jgi:methyl-accepting chemotaxis protein
MREPKKGRVSFRRDHFAYLLIVLLGLAGGAGIHANARMGYQSAEARFRAESHAATLAAANAVQDQFTAIYQNLRTISRLPSVRAVDREGTALNPDSVATIQEIYNNLASDVAVSEVYIVPRDLDSDRIDPVTSAPQKPIMMFASLLEDDSDHVTLRFEAEIYEYHLLHRQMLWFGQNVPTISATDGFNVPMISGAQVITCDNTVYNKTLVNADRTGTIFSVPFFAPNGTFKGSISAIIRIKALRQMLPPRDFVLANGTYGAALVSPDGVADATAPALAVQAQPDPDLIYSEVVKLAVNDPQSNWVLWAGLPNSMFYARPDVQAVSSFARWAYAMLGVILFLAALAVWFVTRNATLIARAATAMEALAGGDEGVQLAGAERSGALGDLARAFATFRDGLIARRMLEQSAELGRHQAEIERQRFDEERAVALAAQKQVVDCLAKALISFAEGDLTWKITEWFSAEYKTLRMDFNQASARMEATMRRVTDSTRNVTTGAGEIRTATTDLARRTEQQAGQLEQSAGTLAEITRAVQKTSQNAGSVAGLAAAAREDATASAGVVQETVQAMSGIESSSRQIANIIGVIDEIAFQTNLLALNAGVEAARAGDAGRGFAVVAMEVRALAQRSADAAKEIKNLISTSGVQVGNGVKLVNLTGDALTRITGQIGELTELVSDIATSARQQAAALNALSATVNQMDHVTQQNAEMVEQAALASARLSEEAAALAKLVDEFKISSHVTGEMPSIYAPSKQQVPRLAVAAAAE